MVQWEIKATEFINCNCSYGCPCQFNARPTNGDCRAVAGFEIEEGHFGDVRLDKLRAAMLVAWPNAIHEGNGTMQLIIDERADDRQRDALLKIMSGEETREMSTMWWIFSQMSPNKPPPVFAPIEFSVDVDGRTASLKVPSVLEAVGEPIRNPISGAPHRARIELPDGFEFLVAEAGSGSTRARGAVELDLKDTHCHFAEIHLTHEGVVA
jgi:hypothetical protein